MAPLFWAGPLVLDEHGSYWMIESQIPATTWQRSLDYCAIPPLSGWVEQLFLAVLGTREWTFRLPSVLGALAALPLVYLAGRQVSSATAGGMAALLLAWHPQAMDEVRIARCYGLVMCLGALLAWGSACWMRRPRSLTAAALWTLAAAGLLWTHYVAALVVCFSSVVLVARLWSAGEGRRPLLLWCATQVLVIGLSLPLVPAVIRLREWGPFLNYSAADQAWFNTLGTLWWAGLPAGLVVALALGKFKSCAKPDRWMWGLLGAMSLLPALLLAVVGQGDLSSLANPRYQVAFAPAGACLVAVLLCRVGGARAAGMGAVAVLAVAWIASQRSPWQLGRLGGTAEEEWRQAAELLQQHAAPGSVIFVQSGLTESYLVPAFPDDDLFLEYVACRISRFYLPDDHPRVGLPFLWPAETGVAEAYRARLEQMASAPTKEFWIAAATDTDLNRNSLAGVQQLAAAAGFTPGQAYEMSVVTLIEYRHQSDLQPESAGPAQSRPETALPTE